MSETVSTAASGAEPARDEGWRVIRPRGRWGLGPDLGQLWRHRDLALILARRDLQVRYRQAAFGVAWAILQPLLAMVLFTLVLLRDIGVSSDGAPYAAFAISGLAVWFPSSRGW